MKERNYSFKIEKLPDSKMRIEVSVLAKEFDRFIKKAVEHLSESIKVSGFRKGKMPRNVVEQSVGLGGILEVGAEKAMKKIYVEIIIDEKIPTVGTPEIKILKIAEGNDFEFSATVDVLPEVKLKEDWEKKIIKINEKFLKEITEVKESEIEKELNFLSEQRAEIKPVERLAKNGDLVELDFTVLRNGVPIEGGTAKNYPLILGKGHFIPGFEEQIIGLSENQEKKFELKFPKEYHEKSLAGEKATFEVKVNKVKERLIPQINDELAKKINSRFKNIQELKDDISKAIKDEKEYQKQENRRGEFINSLVENSNFEIPASSIEREVEIMLAELESDIMKIGLKKEAYFERLKTSEEALKKQWKEKQAQERVKASLILKHLVDSFAIKPSREQVEKRANALLSQYAISGKDASKLDAGKVFETSQAIVSNEMVFEKLAELR